ncbi:GNAT family N-acetyltransferase [Sphingobium sp. 3R8]|uniref:GNAT family N-acetyltransferase n=1 Tax=Sphingobium sp. 3R8 TaxID=2874921 RepID=UPI001CCF1225|nr:GNAT family N-acetyltransferase [Sphingobium sp. 3R8]MBZ9647863.1 GNAT family N-acetyltransferase [Sphingobium sp. 3R8]
MFARTPRLLLRPGWMEDAATLAQTINDPAILRNLSRAPSPYGPDDAQAFLALPQHPHLPRLLAFTRTQGAPRMVGGCGVHMDEDGAPELGYWIARPYWGLGFATEAARAVLGMARANGVRDIRAGHFADNRASGNVLRKLGFRFSGRTAQRYSLGRDALVDCLLFEEGDAGRQSNDPAIDLYRDAVVPMAA